MIYEIRRSLNDKEVIATATTDAAARAAQSLLGGHAFKRASRFHIWVPIVFFAPPTKRVSHEPQHDPDA